MSWTKRTEWILLATAMVCGVVGVATFAKASLFQKHPEWFGYSLPVAANTPSPAKAQTPQPTPESNVPAETSPLRRITGRLNSKRIGLSVYVLEGDDDETLSLSAAHMPGTALPGKDGNVVIAGHRDTFFRPIRKLVNGDRLELEAGGTTRAYVVRSSEVITPETLRVLDPTPDSELTLITCYPFGYIGHAPKRYVIHAQLVQ